MQPFKVNVYVSQQDSDDHDESYTYLVFAESRIWAVRKAVRLTQKDGALLEVGSLRKDGRSAFTSFRLSNSAFKFEYFEDQSTSTAEITEDSEDGLWAQIEVFPTEHQEFWRLSETDVNTLIKWGFKHRRTFGGALKDRLLSALASRTLDCTEELSDYLDMAHGILMKATRTVASSDTPSV